MAEENKKNGIAVYDIEGNKAGEIAVPEKIAKIEISAPFMHEVVKSYLANQRDGGASTKTRSDVRGGGAKPWRQKGTGRARAGTIRSPLWRKGGVIFGPHPKSFRYELPNKKIKIGLDMAVKAKYNGDELIVIKDFTIDKPKTKKIYEILKKLNVNGKKVLLVIEKKDDNMKLAARNMANLELRNISSVNTYDVLNANKVIFSESAMNMFFSK
jgi:large subunit ribosomal protein L4